MQKRRKLNFIAVGGSKQSKRNEDQQKKENKEGQEREGNQLYLGDQKFRKLQRRGNAKKDPKQAAETTGKVSRRRAIQFYLNGLKQGKPEQRDKESKGKEKEEQTSRKAQKEGAGFHPSSVTPSAEGSEMKEIRRKRGRNSQEEKEISDSGEGEGQPRQNRIKRPDHPVHARPQKGQGTELQPRATLQSLGISA